METVMFVLAFLVSSFLGMTTSSAVAMLILGKRAGSPNPGAFLMLWPLWVGVYTLVGSLSLWA